MKKLINIKDKPKRCSKCKKNPRPDKRAICPWSEDIENKKKYCWCCEDCRHQCAMDV